MLHYEAKREILVNISLVFVTKGIGFSEEKHKFYKDTSK